MRSNYIIACALARSLTHRVFTVRLNRCHVDEQRLPADGGSCVSSVPFQIKRHGRMLLSNTDANTVLCNCRRPLLNKFRSSLIYKKVAVCNLLRRKGLLIKYNMFLFSSACCWSVSCSAASELRGQTSCWRGHFFYFQLQRPRYPSWLYAAVSNKHTFIFF